MLTVIYFTTDAGNSPVEEYIDGQAMMGRAAIRAAVVRFIEEFPHVKTVSIKPIEGKVWGIRVRDSAGLQHRILYSVLCGSLLLLHALLKKTQKTPPQAIRLAANRLNQMTE